MLFNSTEFLIFLPCVLLLALALPMPWRNRLLLLASYYFYGSWDWRFLALLIGTTFVDYWVGARLYTIADPRRRKRWLLLSLAANLGTLGFFKYYNFFVQSAVNLLQEIGLNASPPVLSVILPVGISFYVFQSMSYTIDIYRGQMKPATNLWDFALYVAYFPQLVAGPIERATQLLPQIIAPAPLTPGRINTAATLMVMGFAKKVLIADQLAPEVERIFSASGTLSSGELLRGAYFFAFQIYGDFSGYSDIARGVSELFGIRLMINFNQPYLARSITDFWRRWHISLSTWLRDYLYIPLGGNRHGRNQTYRNLMLTMLIGGLWHGANWTFVAWGGLHGGLLAVERALGLDRAQPLRLRSVRDLAWGGVQIVITFHLVVMLWIFFRAPNFVVAFHYLAGIAAFTDLAAIGAWPFVVGGCLLALDVPQYASGRHTILWRLPWWIRSPLYAGVSLSVLLLLVYGGREQAFIYFQF